MESYMGNSRAYYPQGLPPPSTIASVSTTLSGTTSLLSHHNAAPTPYPSSTSRAEYSRMYPGPSPSPGSSHHSRVSPHLSSYSNRGTPPVALPPSPYQSPRPPVAVNQQRHQQQSQHSEYLRSHAGLPHTVTSYTPMHSRPPDMRTLEVTRVGPAHTFSSISPEASQIITSRPNLAHNTSVTSAYDYKEPRTYLESPRPPSAAQRNRPSTSSKPTGRVSHHQHPTLIKAEEPTTLSAAHYNLVHPKKFETATAPVPFALAKKADDAYFSEKFKESFAHIRKVENPYALNDATASTSRFNSAEVEIKRQKNDTYRLQPQRDYPMVYSKLNGAESCMEQYAPENLSKPKKDDTKSDLVLDLSVKTVRQTADSTAPELEAFTPSSTPGGYYSSSTSSRNSPYSLSLSSRASQASPRHSDYNVGIANYVNYNGVQFSPEQTPNLPLKRFSDSPQSVSNKYPRLESSKSPYFGSQKYPASNSNNADPYLLSKTESSSYHPVYDLNVENDPYKQWAFYSNKNIKSEVHTTKQSSAYDISHNISSHSYNERQSSSPYLYRTTPSNNRVTPNNKEKEECSTLYNASPTNKELRIKSEIEINNSISQKQPNEHIIPIALSSGTNEKSKSDCCISKTTTSIMPNENTKGSHSSSNQSNIAVSSSSESVQQSCNESKLSFNSRVTIVGKSDILSMAHEELTKIDQKEKLENPKNDQFSKEALSNFEQKSKVSTENTMKLSKTDTEFRDLSNIKNSTDTSFNDSETASASNKSELFNMTSENELSSTSKCEVSEKDTCTENIDCLENKDIKDEKSGENVMCKNSPNFIKQRLLSNVANNVPVKNAASGEIKNISIDLQQNTATVKPEANNSLSLTPEVKEVLAKDIIGNSIAKAFKESENTAAGQKQDISIISNKNKNENQPIKVPLSEGFSSLPMQNTVSTKPTDLSSSKLHEFNTRSSNMSPWQSSAPFPLKHTNEMTPLSNKGSAPPPPPTHQDAYVSQRYPSESSYQNKSPYNSNIAVSLPSRSTLTPHSPRHPPPTSPRPLPQYYGYPYQTPNIPLQSKQHIPTCNPEYISHYPNYISQESKPHHESTVKSTNFCDVNMQQSSYSQMSYGYNSSTRLPLVTNSYSSTPVPQKTYSSSANYPTQIHQQHYSYSNTVQPVNSQQFVSRPLGTKDQLTYHNSSLAAMHPSVNSQYVSCSSQINTSQSSQQAQVLDTSPYYKSVYSTQTYDYGQSKASSMYPQAHLPTSASQTSGMHSPSPRGTSHYSSRNYLGSREPVRGQSPAYNDHLKHFANNSKSKDTGSLKPVPSNPPQMYGHPSALKSHPIQDSFIPVSVTSPRVHTQSGIEKSYYSQATTYPSQATSNNIYATSRTVTPDNSRSMTPSSYNSYYPPYKHINAKSSTSAMYNHYKSSFEMAQSKPSSQYEYSHPPVAHASKASSFSPSQSNSKFPAASFRKPLYNNDVKKDNILYNYPRQCSSVPATTVPTFPSPYVSSQSKYAPPLSPANKLPSSANSYENYKSSYSCHQQQPIKTAAITTTTVTSTNANYHSSQQALYQTHSNYAQQPPPMQPNQAQQHFNSNSSQYYKHATPHQSDTFKQSSYYVPQPAHNNKYRHEATALASGSAVSTTSGMVKDSKYSYTKNTPIPTLQPENLSSKSNESGKSALAEKLQKKLIRNDSNESLFDQKEQKSVLNNDLDSMFSNFLGDLESHKDSVTSKKSRIVTRRYQQKVQIQKALDNNEVPVIAPFEEEEDSESEGEVPLKKFRGKFKSIKDKAEERVILTYASHSDDSATEMIPDEDASDFEEELIKEIKAKARKGKVRGKSSKLIEKTTFADYQSHRDDNEKKTKKDDEQATSSSECDVDDDSSSISSRGSSNSDSSSADTSSSDADHDFTKRKRGSKGRRVKSHSETSNSDKEFTPRKSLRNKARSSSEESYSPIRSSRRKKDLKENIYSRKKRGRRSKDKHSSKRRIKKEAHAFDTDSETEIANKKKPKGRPPKNVRLKRHQVSTSESEDDVVIRRRKKKPKESIKKISSSGDEEVASVLKNETTLLEKIKTEKPDTIKDNFEETLLLNENDGDKLSACDSVILKLKREKDMELKREDVVEMKNWRDNATVEVKKLLGELPETRMRDSWKKPSFQEDFRKGWQNDVKKYKRETARIPKKLISTPSPPISKLSNQEKDKQAVSKKGKSKAKSISESQSPAKSTRSKSGIIKTSMAIAQRNDLKAPNRPEMSSVMQKFFEKVLGNELLDNKKYPCFAPYSPPTRTPTGLTPTPSVALSMMASDDSDKESLVNLRHDLPASDSGIPVSKKSSIANSLIKRFKKKYNAKRMDMQWLNKSRSLMEPTNKPQLLPTPGLSADPDNIEDLAGAQDPLKLKTFFRTDSVNRYRENFDEAMLNQNINTLTPVLVPSRTRNKSKAILDAATIRSVFGLSPPPLSTKSKDEESATKTKSVKKEKKALPVNNNNKNEKLLRRELLLQRDSPNFSSVSSTPTDFIYNDEYDSEIRSERSGSSLRELAIMHEIKKSGRRLRKIRKFRSGFDYIRKKKKAKTEEELLNTVKRKLVSENSFLNFLHCECS